VTGPSLDEARGGRSRIQGQLRQIQGRRPAAGAELAARASWLRDKASVHDQIAGYLRQIGDIAGAVEAEVLATRCRADAADLIRDDGTVTTVLGPCPALVLPTAGSTSKPYGYCQFDAPPPQRTDQTDRVEDVTCGPGLP
jgi:hypothetical protein